MEGGGDGVLHAEDFGGGVGGSVGVKEGEGVAEEGEVVEEGFYAGALGGGGGVGVGGREDWWVASFDEGVYTGFLSVGGVEIVDVVVEGLVGLDVVGDEEFGFVGDVAED